MQGGLRGSGGVLYETGAMNGPTGPYISDGNFPDKRFYTESVYTRPTSLPKLFSGKYSVLVRIEPEP